MAALREKSNSQLSFLKNDGIKSFFFITNQKNLLFFLSSGMITPSASQFRYRTDSRELSLGAIPFWKGGLPVVEEKKANIWDKSQVVIEFAREHIENYAGKATVYDSGDLVVVNAPVPMSLVSSIYMSSNEEIEDFLLRLPSDIIFDRSLFSSQLVFSDVVIHSPENLSITDISSQIEAVDSLAGGIRVVGSFFEEDGLELLPIVPAILTFLKVLWPEDVKWNGAGIEVSSADQILLTALIPLLNKYKEENGYDPMSFLDSLASRVKESSGTLSEELIKWFSYVRALVNAEKEVKPLTDEGNIIQRAILLFILRPKLERLQNIRESSISPSPKVLAIAVFFAGCAAGATRLASKFKGDFYSYTRYVKSVLDAVWDKPDINANLFNKSIPGKGVSTCFEINGQILIQSEPRQDSVLVGVLNQVRSCGCEINYDLESNELIYKSKIDGKGTQLVYIERINSANLEGFNLIRIVSPCLHLSASKMRSLKKAQLLDMLFRNDSNDACYAYALSEKRKALVVEITHIANTMGNSNFISIINHIANIAAMYES